MPPALLVDDLTMRYPDTVATDRLTLTVETGTITAVLGPNGAGKTTTLETAVGFRRAQRGQVRTLGLDPVADRARLLPRIGVMPQSGGAWSGVRAHEMLRHIASLYAHPLDVPMLIDRLGLGSCGRTPYRRLSGGQQQRLGLAMAMVGRPELLFVDEPTAGMDPQARRASWELLGELRRDGVTVVLTTHLIDEAERLADQVYVLDHGRVLAAGSPAELVAGPPGPVPAGGGGGATTMTLCTGRPLPAATLTAALVAADCPGVEVVPAGVATLRLVGPISPAVVSVVAGCCQREGTDIVEMRQHRNVDPAAAADWPSPDPVDRRTRARSLEDVFLDLTGRQIR